MKERIISNEQIREFRNYLKREEKSTATCEKYVRDVAAFAGFLMDQPVSKESVVTWKKGLVEQGYAVRSVNSMLASVNSFLDFLGWHECRVKHLRIQRQIYCAEDKELTKAEYLRLLEASKKNEQLRMIIQTICATGIRVSELCWFTVEALEYGEITVNCKNKTRNILVPGKLRTRLLEYAKRKNIHCGAVFVGKTGKPLDRSCIWRQMKALCDRAGVKKSKVFPHNLRKLFAKTFYAVEKDIAKLADVLGHSNINTTRIYIMSSGAEHRKKVERLGLLI